MASQTRVAEAFSSARDPADAQFRLLVESVSDYAIYLLDPVGRVMSWNAGAARIKGYRAGEILGRHFSLFYTAEDRAAGRPQALLEQAAREGRTTAEGWRVRKDGTRFWADVVITALRDQKGALNGFAKVTRDVTELRESEERLRAFTDHSPTSMFLKDTDGRYRFVNRDFLERFGLAAGQVIGRRDAEIFPGEQGERFAKTDAEALAGGAMIAYEHPADTVRGERLHWVVKFPVRDAAGQIAGVGGIATDITDARRAERSLLEQRTLLAEAQQLAGLGSWEWDPGSGRMTWSDQLARIYGVDPAACAPSFAAYLELVHPEDRQRSADLVARALTDARGFVLEERIVRPDGALRTLHTNGEPVLDAQGRVVKVLAASLDVTEQRAIAAHLQSLTRRLVQAEELERRRIAGELHDRVGQTLSALNINLDIVLAMLGDGAPPEVRGRLRDSLALVDGTLQSIENVMADLRPPLLEEYGLGAALGWYAEEFARRTGIAVEFDDAAHERNRALPRESGVALFRIAQEALNNVAKHSRARRVVLRLEAPEEELVLTVADDGVGFDARELEGRSSRWGMTTMRERVTAAGGSLRIESVPGKGTTLTATAPF